MKLFSLILDISCVAILPISAFMVGNNNLDYLFPLCTSFVGLLWSLLNRHRRQAS